MTWITAHSGCEGTERDSLQSIDEALRLGADVIEVDVRMDEQDVLRISHDRLTAAEYAVKPTLSDVFSKIIQTPLKINLDIKEQRSLYPALDLAEKFGLKPDRLILTGCQSPEQLVRDETICERAAVFINIEEILKTAYIRHETDYRPADYAELMNRPWPFLKKKGMRSAWLEDLFAIMKNSALAGLNLPHDLLTADFSERLAKERIPLSVWTVNEADTVRFLLELGVHNITTLRVRQALTLRDQSGR